MLCVRTDRSINRRLHTAGTFLSTMRVCRVMDNTVFTTRLTTSNAIKLHLALISSSLAARKVRLIASLGLLQISICLPPRSVIAALAHTTMSPCPLLLVISLVACRFLISVSFVFPRDEPASERLSRKHHFPWGDSYQPTPLEHKCSV